MPSIDQYSLATVPIQLLFNGTLLSSGTAFIWQVAGQHYLITNWHNVSGRDPNTDRHLSPTAAEPNRLDGFFNTRNANLGDKHHVGLCLRNNGDIAWMVHPQRKRAVDVVAIPLTGPVTQTIEFHPINKMPSHQIMLAVGIDVFVLGYPFGPETTGLPVWKRGSIASEPELVPGTSPCLHIDTASRPGMSGSPVIIRTSGPYKTPEGNMAITAGATKFLGVYSGRLRTQDPLEAQIGMVWPAVFIDEIIAGGLKDYG